MGSQGVLFSNRQETVILLIRKIIAREGIMVTASDVSRFLGIGLVLWIVTAFIWALCIAAVESRKLYAAGGSNFESFIKKCRETGRYAVAKRVSHEWRDSRTTAYARATGHRDSIQICKYEYEVGDKAYHITLQYADNEDPPTELEVGWFKNPKEAIFGTQTLWDYGQKPIRHKMLVNYPPLKRVAS